MCRLRFVGIRQKWRKFRGAIIIKNFKIIYLDKQNIPPGILPERNPARYLAGSSVANLYFFASHLLTGRS